MVMGGDGGGNGDGDVDDYVSGDCGGSDGWWW